MWKRNHSLPEQIERGLVMNENLFRPQFDTLKLSDKLWLMQTLATRYNLTFKELYAFSRWRQSCTTGLFEKGGREFVFVPGDTVILGWEGFIQGMDKANQEELADIFAEIEYEGTAEEFLRQGMTPVRQMTIGPMFVGRKLEEIGWESVPMNDPRITAHPEWLENLQRWAGQDSQSFEIHETVRFERNADSWRAWLCHPMTYPEFQRSLLWELAASLPTPDEWAYLCGGGCRTLFPWGDGLDYKMKLHHFEREEEQGKSYDIEQANFFGLSIAYDPYKRELVDGKTLTTCGGDGGCNICGGIPKGTSKNSFVVEFRFLVVFAEQPFAALVGCASNSGLPLAAFYDGDFEMRTRNRHHPQTKRPPSKIVLVERSEIVFGFARRLDAECCALRGKAGSAKG